MAEKQPLSLNSQSITPPKGGANLFKGFAIHGVFMGNNLELTDVQQKDLQEKIKSIRQHRN